VNVANLRPVDSSKRHDEPVVGSRNKNTAHVKLRWAVALVLAAVVAAFVHAMPYGGFAFRPDE